VLVDLAVPPLFIERLELEVTDLGTDPGATQAERFQRRRTRLRGLTVRVSSAALDDRVSQIRKQLSKLGVTQLSARLNDGFVSVRARAADGLAAAELSFRIQLVQAGSHLRALASTVRVHGHLPSPGPVIADRILSALLDATEETPPVGPLAQGFGAHDADRTGSLGSAGLPDRPHARGLCDVEIDLIGALLWHLMPPSGWRLPAVSNIELTAIKITRSSIEIGYGPPGTRSGELGVRQSTHLLAAAHDLMHSVDQHLRDGHLEDAMRGYRALLAAGGPDQPLLLERILALASARPSWFFDGLELARQALGRWPSFPPAHAALASITLAQGDARESAAHLMQLAQLASAEGDDDQAALAGLAGARLLRVLEPKSATQLYQLALEHDPGSSEAADSLADRLADEQRWPELVRLVRARAVSTADTGRAVQLRLRLADVFVHQLGDLASAQVELAAARNLAPEEPAIHEMTATILGSSDPAKAIEAWREVARLAELRGDHRAGARAWAILGDLLASSGGGGEEQAWSKSIELDPLQADALAGLAIAAGARADHDRAAELFERMRGLGLPQHTSARHELMLARSLLVLGRVDDARSSLRRATLAGGETAAEAHAVLADLAEASSDLEHAAVELDVAIASLVDLATDDLGDGERLYTRAAQLAIARAGLLDRGGQPTAAATDWQRAYSLAQRHAPELARHAARTLLARAGDDANLERRWLDAVLATRPSALERAALLVRRADIRRRERTPDLAAALGDLREGLQLSEHTQDPEALETRRRAYQLEAELLAQSGDRRARAQALASLALMAEPSPNRIEVETAAAAAWLAADEPAAALPHAARAQAQLTADVPAPLRREVLATLGEAAWRQRAWKDAIRAYRGLIEDPGPELPRVGTFRYRLAVAADRTGDQVLALETLRPMIDDPETARGTSPELRGQALRLFADLAERAGDLGGAATALEGFAALAIESSATARADAMYRAGELFRRADRSEDAIRCLEAALRISDTHLPALDALEAVWRERGDVERVSVILGRKVAATARHPARQKPLLSRLGDLQAQLGRPDVALATHQRALEIDPAWRPSLRYVTVRLRDAGQIVAAAGGLAQLAGELPNDAGVDLAIVARERQIAAIALAELVLASEDAQLDAIREVASLALERTTLDAPARANRTEPGEGSSPLAITFTEVAGALARLRGELTSRPERPIEEDTQSGRIAPAGPLTGGARSLRDAAARDRASGKLDDALATLETANHVSPGDPVVLRDLVELASQTEDHEAAARHLAALAALSSGARRGDVLLELADVYYDRLEDPIRGREAMRAAADALGSGARRDATLRMLASEASTHLAWDVAVDALSAIAGEKRAAADVRSLAIALTRAGRDADGIAVLEEAGSRFEDGGELLSHLRAEALRKASLAVTLEQRASASPGSEAGELRAEAGDLRAAIGEPADDAGAVNPDAGPGAEATAADAATEPAGEPSDASAAGEPAADAGEPGAVDPSRTTTLRGTGSEKPPASPGMYSIRRNRESSQPPIGRLKLVAITPGDAAVARLSTDDDNDDEDAGWVSVSDPRIKSGPIQVPDESEDVHEGEPAAQAEHVAAVAPVEPDRPSVVISGTPSETAFALDLAAASADRDRLLAARREHPDDPSMLLAVLAHLGNREPALRRDILEDAARTSKGRALAIALHELALLARDARDASRASALWTRAHETDPAFAPVWIHLADAVAAADDLDTARALYERVAAASEYDESRRAFAADRAEALGRDESIVRGEIQPRAQSELRRAMLLSEAEDWPGAIAAAERAATADPSSSDPLELLEKLYLASGDVTSASEAIGRQLMVIEDPPRRAMLWQRRARLYRDTLGRDAEAYRCLKEAHACSPVDPEIAYQLRTAAMVRGEWALAASLLYREIGASANPRDRGALHLELALIYEERLEDDAQAQVNYEQALAFDPSIPAAKLPLARRYEQIGRHTDAARLYEDAASTARAGDRASLLAAAARARTVGAERVESPDLAAQLERAEAAGDLEAARELAHQLWSAKPGHASAFRLLANFHRTSGDLAALSELTTIRTNHAESSDDRASAWLEVARLAEEVGSFDQAARAYDLALIEDPSHVGALDARGSLAFRIGDFATADLIYRDLGPGESVLGDDELALRRSMIAEQLGRDTEALEHARVAAAAAPARRDLLMRVQELATRGGELDLALAAARSVLELVPLDDDDAQLATSLALVELQRQAGDIEAAVSQLERVLRDHPLHAPTLEALAELQMARSDWAAATRYLYQLVPLAPSPVARAERLYRLGEAVLVHLGDTDRADDVFLRASDLDPSHIPTLRRLLDVYWRADDPGALVEVASELADKNALANGPLHESSLGHALVAAALLGDTQLANQIGVVLGDEAPRRVAAALAELAGREGRLQLATASTAISELARRGMIDLAKLRAAAAGTPVAFALA
jgi:tetratricopeptide (TPR) repeat protein